MKTVFIVRYVDTVANGWEIVDFKTVAAFAPDPGSYAEARKLADRLREEGGYRRDVSIDEIPFQEPERGPA